MAARRRSSSSEVNSHSAAGGPAGASAGRQSVRSRPRSSSPASCGPATARPVGERRPRRACAPVASTIASAAAPGSVSQRPSWSTCGVSRWPGRRTTVAPARSSSVASKLTSPAATRTVRTAPARVRSQSSASEGHVGRELGGEALGNAASTAGARHPCSASRTAATAAPLLTLLYHRQVCSMNVLADLLEVTATCIGNVVKETREILEDHGHDPGAAPIRFTTPDALLAFAASDLRPARTTVIEQLSHPALTGLTRPELHDLTTRLAARQSAHAERLSCQRRGGPRQPGTRGGVFHQKISNSERILLTLLYHRRLCTLDVLADALGDVSRSAIGNVIRETLPLLQQQERIPGPAPTRYRTAADLLAAGTANDTATS